MLYMFIKPINFSYNNYSYCNSYNTKPINTSFKGNLENYKNSSSVSTAINTISKLLKEPAFKLTPEYLQKCLNVEILPMSAYNGICKSQAGALYHYLASGFGTIKDCKIYIDTNIDDNKDSKTKFLSDLAHEYTHYLQSQNDFKHKAFFEEVKKQGWYKEETLYDIVSAATEAYLNINEVIFDFVLRDLLKDSRFITASKTGFLLDNFLTDEDSLVKQIDYNNKDDFIKTFKENSEIDLEVKRLLFNNKYLAKDYTDNPETFAKLENLISEFCKANYKNEAEAYYVSNQIFKIQGYDEKHSEVGYKMSNLVAKALE